MSRFRHCRGRPTPGVPENPARPPPATTPRSVVQVCQLWVLSTQSAIKSSHESVADAIRPSECACRRRWTSGAAWFVVPPAGRRVRRCRCMDWGGSADAIIRAADRPTGGTSESHSRGAHGSRVLVHGAGGSARRSETIRTAGRRRATGAPHPWSWVDARRDRPDGLACRLRAACSAVVARRDPRLRPSSDARPTGGRTTRAHAGRGQVIARRHQGGTLPRCRRHARVWGQGIGRGLRTRTGATRRWPTR